MLCSSGLISTCFFWEGAEVKSQIRGMSSDNSSHNARICQEHPRHPECVLEWRSLLRLFMARRHCANRAKRCGRDNSGRCSGDEVSLVQGRRARWETDYYRQKVGCRCSPLRVDIASGSSETGFQATALIFPTEGCWEITVKVGDTALTFVNRVIRAE